MVFLVEAHLKVTSEPVLVQVKGHCMPFRATKPQFAAEHDIDEIVVGFKQRSAIGEMVFGSNYRYLIAKAPCPVVTVHDWQ